MTHSIRELLLVVVALLAVATPAWADDVSADATTNAHAVSYDSTAVSAFVLTISGRPLGVLSIPVAEIRATVSRDLSSTLLKYGPIVPQPQVLQIMNAWRVRSGNSIPREFLDSLAVGLKVRRLVVANLVVERNELTMTARHLDPASAELQDVVVVHRTILENQGADGTLAQVREITRVAADIPASDPSPQRPRLLILNSEPVGCSRGDALIASHILLQHYVKNRDRALVDPAVTIATLHDAGHSERYLGADARILLQGAFGSSALIIPQLISYAPRRRAATQLLEYDDVFDRGGPQLTDFALSLRLIDLNSGSIVAGLEAFLPVPPQTGWFGVPEDDTIIDRMNIAADRLWNGIHNALEAY